MNSAVAAVGSIRRPKLDAVREALAALGPMLDDGAEFDVVGVEVSSGVRHTPLSRGELMRGARQRAEELLRIARERRMPWRYFVGLEGGVDVIRDDQRRSVFLENWAYVADTVGHGSFGQSGAVPLPEQLARAVVDEGMELSQAIDAFAGTSGIRDAQGAWGVLTNNLISRRDALRISVINAFAPFLKPGRP